MADFYALPNPNLRSYLERQVEGQSRIITTPFAEGESTEELLSGWNTYLEGMKAPFTTLYSFEQDMRSKVGPLSVQRSLKDRLPSIEDYYNAVEHAGEPISEEAIQRFIIECRRAKGLRMRQVDATVASMKLSTNSGNPYFTTRRRVLEQTTPYLIEREGVSDWKVTLPEWIGYLCATLGWRGQEGGPDPDDVKQRVLWMFSFAANIEELRVYQPLIQAFQKAHLVPGWEGNDEVDKRITRLFDTKGNNLLICTDFSKFDQHMNHNMQLCAETVLSQLFDDSASFQRWKSSCFPIKYTLPLCYQWGYVMKGLHGMGSGSGGTNADETLSHRCLQHEAALLHAAQLNVNSMCLGDDGVLSYPGITVNQIVDAYERHGQVCNVEKQYASQEDCVYLRRWHHRDYRVDGVCVGVYSTMRALGRLRYMERWIDPKKWGQKAVAMRQLSILENCRYHPLGEEFVQYCAKRDKFRLGKDIPGFMDNLDAEYRKAEAEGTLVVSYSATFGNPKPPSQWWVTKVVNNL
nr:RNA-dependent RNA polymerase [Picobirnavirus sp.]AVD97021.1 RNA-dependent RNA polymerase [Picobirnavirus sp.]AVD97022.1 RNA-dependent RNA polymerase [Picobirnavirus sp.]